MTGITLAAGQSDTVAQFLASSPWLRWPIGFVASAGVLGLFVLTLRSVRHVFQSGASFGWYLLFAGTCLWGSLVYYFLRMDPVLRAEVRAAPSGGRA